MSVATDSDPKTVKVRNGSAPSERTRERLTEESLSSIRRGLIHCALVAR